MKVPTLPSYDGIGDDWMVDLMIIYIEKTIVKALDINDIIKKQILEMSTR
jgi:hypothetical protein